MDSGSIVISSQIIRLFIQRRQIGSGYVLVFVHSCVYVWCSGWPHIGCFIAVQQNDICPVLHVPQQPVTNMIGCSSVLQFSLARSLSLRQAAATHGRAMSCRPLYRSRSLPQLHTVGSYSEQLRRGVGGGTRIVAAEVRQLLTLKQHYYPEGGWGWVVVFVGVLVQLLSHGLHVASGVLVGEVVRRFGGGVVIPAGEYVL